MAEAFNSQGMLDSYLFECGELLEHLQEIVLEKKDEEYFDEESINEIFRTMHTIKGTSGMMMFDEITQIAHKLEDVFFYLREAENKNVPHIELVEHVLQVVDFISGELTKIENAESVDGIADEYLKELDRFIDKIKGSDEETERVMEKNVHTEPEQFYIPPKVTSASHYYKIFLTYKNGLDLVNVHAYRVVYALKEIAEDLLHYPEDIISDDDTSNEILENGFKILLQTQGSEADIRKIIKVGYDVTKVEIRQCTQTEFQQGFEPEESGGQKDLKTIAPGDFVIESKEPGKGRKLAKDKTKKYEKTSFISVDVQKMDMLMDLMGELLVSQSLVLQNQDLKVPGVELHNFNNAAEKMVKISAELQNIIMGMRMVPLTNTFRKMNRIVFDMSRKLGKEIDFEMLGENTEVDKKIIEHISDPLMHLVRNSVDHGIELPMEREAAGKTEKGRITLSAKIEEGNIVIYVQDNGKGLDRQKIWEKAGKQGLLDLSKADSDYTDKEVYQFITLPGFSTNEQVTEYSGRGVGMDVVVSNLQSIGGSLEIESALGQGSRMILKIPGNHL